VVWAQPAFVYRHRRRCNAPQSVQKQPSAARAPTCRASNAWILGPVDKDVVRRKRNLGKGTRDLTARPVCLQSAKTSTNDSTPTLCGWTAEVEVGRAGGCGVGTWCHVLGQPSKVLLLPGGMATGPSIQSIRRTVGCGGYRYGISRYILVLFSIIAQLISRSLRDTISNTV
jgi:hypothetical protein